MDYHDHHPCRLFGIVSCSASYFYKIQSEIQEQTNLDTTCVMTIVLHRRDDLETVVMDMDRPFMRIMSSEAENTIHKLHPPHRYKLISSLSPNFPSDLSSQLDL